MKVTIEVEGTPVTCAAVVQLCSLFDKDTEADFDLMGAYIAESLTFYLDTFLDAVDSGGLHDDERTRELVERFKRGVRELEKERESIDSAKDSKAIHFEPERRESGALDWRPLRQMMKDWEEDPSRVSLRVILPTPELAVRARETIYTSSYCYTKLDGNTVYVRPRQRPQRHPSTP